MHSTPLITTIAAAFTVAWLLGLLTQWLRLSPIVGYLLAGVVIGPHTPGYVGNVDIAQELAEIGVILLMFGVGLHFHLKDLLAVRAVAIPGAIGQSVVATVAGAAVFAGFGWPLSSGIVMGMAMAVASTVVLIRVLTDNNALESPSGHIAVGWLIVEDIVTVVLLVVLPAMGSAPGSAPGMGVWASLGLAILKLVVLVVIVMVGGSWVIPKVMVAVTRLKSRELFTLTVLVFSIAVATASYVFFGASVALGAFLAGMVVAQSPVSHQAAADALPMRDAFAVIFFVAVGMLFDPWFLVDHPLMALAAVGIVMIIKPLAALVIVVLLGHTSRTALVVAVGLAQIGEFSFILSEVAKKQKLLDETGHNALVAAAIISITLNPLCFKTIEPLEAAIKRRPRVWAFLNRRAERRVKAVNVEAVPDTSAARTAVVVGYGHVGQSVERILRESGLETVVVDMNLDTVLALRNAGRVAVFGDATRPSVLEQAGVETAAYLVVALPHAGDNRPVIAAARQMNTDLHILVRARYMKERDGLIQAGANDAIFEEAEAAVALGRLVMTDLGAGSKEIATETRRLRSEGPTVRGARKDEDH